MKNVSKKMTKAMMYRPEELSIYAFYKEGDVIYDVYDYKDEYFAVTSFTGKEYFNCFKVNDDLTKRLDDKLYTLTPILRCQHYNLTEIPENDDMFATFYDLVGFKVIEQGGFIKKGE